MTIWVSIFEFFFMKFGGKELESFIFCGIKDQIFGDKKEIVSLPYLTLFGFHAYNSLRIFKWFGIVSLTLKASLNIAEEKAMYVFMNFNC